MKYDGIVYIGDEDQYSLFFNKYCRKELVNNLRIIHLDKNLMCHHNKNLSSDYKRHADQMNIQNALIITEENWNCSDFITKEINRIFFPHSGIRTNCIINENQWTIARYWKDHFNIEIINKNDRATNRFELMEIE